MSFFKSLKDSFNESKVRQTVEIDKWLLMASPVYILAIMTVYLVFVLRLGPFIMKNRPAMQLRKAMIFYNSAQVVISIWVIYNFMKVDIPILGLFSPQCAQKFYKDNNENINVIAIGAWWCFISKITDLFDTVFFVLRKQSRQISFLHVYHHTNMVLFPWFMLKHGMVEHSTFGGIINSSVHVIMYTYYMIAAMGPQYKKYLWWKKYMTIIQLVQFCIIIFYFALLSVSNCSPPKSIMCLSIANMFTFLFLFVDFYRKAYRKPSKKLAVGNKEEPIKYDQNTHEKSY